MASLKETPCRTRDSLGGQGTTLETCTEEAGGKGRPPREEDGLGNGQGEGPTISLYVELRMYHN